MYLPLDAVTSIYPLDREYAFNRFLSLAAQSDIHLTISSAESVMFELIGDAAKPDFKKLIPQLKEYASIKKKYTGDEHEKHRSSL